MSFPDDYNSGDILSADDLNKIKDGAGWLSMEFGENIDGSTTPQVVYQKAEDGKIYKADASYIDERSNVLGLTKSNKTSGNNGYIQTSGYITIPTQTLETTISSVADQKFTYIDYGDQNTINTTNYISQGFMVGDQVGNISSIKVRMRSDTSSTAKIEIYNMDDNGKPTGSVLGTSDTISIASSTGFYEFTFSTPCSVSPGDKLCFVVKGVSGDDMYLRSTPSTTDQQGYNIVKNGSANGYTQLSYSSSDSGSSWTSSVPICFETYTTKRKIQYGDPIFLSETAGEFSLVKPSGTNVAFEKMGELISTDKMIIKKRIEKFLGSSKADVKATSYSGYYSCVGVPPRTNKIIANINYEDKTEGEVILTNEIKSITIKDYNGSGSYSIIATWNGNIFYINKGKIEKVSFYS